MWALTVLICILTVNDLLGFVVLPKWNDRPCFVELCARPHQCPFQEEILLKRAVRLIMGYTFFFCSIMFAHRSIYYEVNIKMIQVVFRWQNILRFLYFALSFHDTLDCLCFMWDFAQPLYGSALLDALFLYKIRNWKKKKIQVRSLGIHTCMCFSCRHGNCVLFFSFLKVYLTQIF